MKKGKFLKITILSILVGAVLGIGKGLYLKSRMQEQTENSITPQEQIISRIATTNFADRTVEVSPVKESALQVLQAAIDSCSLAGGGMVKVKAGHYALNGSLHLKSNVNLYLEEGAYLQFSGRADDFLPVVLTRWEGTELYGHSPMVYAYHCTTLPLRVKV